MMNDTIPKVKTANILLVDVDDRQTAMLRMAFKMYHSVNYTLVTENDTPDLVLMDGDNAENKDAWLQLRQRFPDAKIIFFSVNPPAFTAPYLAKPIQFNTLFTHLRNLQQGNGIWVADGEQAKPEPAEQAETVQKVPDQAKPVAAESKHPAHEHQQAKVIVRFNTKGTLFDKVRQLTEQEEDTAIIVNHKPVLIVFPSIKKVLLTATHDELYQLCAHTEQEWQTRHVPATANLHEKAKLSIQACIWQLAIWTARGRLIEPITPETMLRLKTWPNMTRLAYLPESMRLSAFLVKSPVALNTLYKLLPVTLENILNYIAATYAIGSLAIEQPVGQSVLSKEQDMVLSRKDQQIPTKSVRVDQDSENVSDDAAKPKGLLSRLIGRLRGN
ncbi:response regulator [Neisseriaceae bacterium ESL0693]|nr:response regulator [Neisseriaceae bacterium ESL0693]